MASSKTLTPTNVTISIPAMTDVPDASVFSNCVDKEADAINTLNRKLKEIHSGTITATTTANGNIPTNLSINNTIIGAKITDNVNNIVLPFNNYGVWAFNVRTGDAQLSAVANTQVTIYYEYI